MPRGIPGSGKSRRKPVREQPRYLQVWIELPVEGLEPADKKRAAELANNMVRRMYPETDRKFFYSEREARYCWGGPMGYTVLSDNGTWLNLDFLGRPLDQSAEAWEAAERAKD